MCEAFQNAQPSLTHMSLLTLLRNKRIHGIVTQNIDGLHLRSGIPPESLAEMHGNRCLQLRVSFV